MSARLRSTRAVARAQARRARLHRDEQPAVAHQRDARDQAVGQIEVVRRQHDDRAARGERAQPIATRSPTARSSRPVNGSSSSTSRGSCSSARSSASRCRMPRENPLTRRRARSAGRRARAPRRRRRRHRGRTARRRTPGSAAPTARDRGAARARAGRCRRAARRRARRPDARRTAPRPLLGATSVASMPISVDLPAPFGPSRPTMSPGARVSETCDTARRRPKCRETSSELNASRSRRSRSDAPTGSAGSGPVVVASSAP